MPGLIGSALTSSFENLAASLGLGVKHDTSGSRRGERNDESTMTAEQSLQGPRRSSFVVRIDRDVLAPGVGLVERDLGLATVGVERLLVEDDRHRPDRRVGPAGDHGGGGGDLPGGHPEQAAERVLNALK